MIHEHIPLLIEHLDTIATPEVREAYLFLTHHAAALSGYECRPQDKGEVRDFRYYCGTEQPFALIVNQKSLLWYFRLPGLKHRAADLDNLRSHFNDVKENAAGEITLRITSLADAKRLVDLIFGSGSMAS
jgi:hypothetical protein